MTGNGTSQRRPRVAAWLLLGAAASCTGNLGAPAGPNGPGAGAHGAGPSTDSAEAPVGDARGRDDPTPLAPGASALRCAADAPIDPGPAPLRLLSRAQYLNTLRDLFGAAGDVGASLTSVAEPSELGLLQADVAQVELEDFQKAADTIAAKVIADKTLLATLAPCTGSDKRACARSFVQRLGSRAYRAPLSDATDLERHLKLYDLGARTSHEHGLELVLRGMLQSSRFLYRVELGTTEQVADAAVRLSDHEMAARLSYVFWKTLPDDALTQAAAAGKLHTPDDIAAALARMLGDARGKPALRQFLEAFMHLEQLPNLVKDPKLYPEWQRTSFRSALHEQARAFFQHVLDQQGGSLEALLTSTSVPINPELAGFYGVSAGPGFSPVTRDDGHTAGLLSLPAFLAIQAKPDESSPIHRGKFVREALLCEQLPTPPANIPKPPEVMPGVSTRERMREHAENPACSVCHVRLDPLGFGFESFDGIGRFRSSDGGRAVDARGELIGSRDADGTFEGVVELGARLAHSAQVEECMTRQWFRFALGRFEQGLDDCSVERVLSAFRQEGGSLHALPRAIVTSDAFLYRRPLQKVAP
jgi:Protein of unknown function (DUF1592)/Protein of unknown function (DUF1588)/Protein of unknown function (DUF1585)/Protein of unknown function (DUF1595)/Protein of unknown function (DUF1587)